MGNCLVTKLKGVVDNPNLPYLNLRFTAQSNPSNGQIDIWAGITNAVKVTILSEQTLEGVSGDAVAIDSKSFYAGTYRGAGRNYISNHGSEVTLKIENKYDMGFIPHSIYGDNIDLNQFEYYTHITDIEGSRGGFTGNLDAMLPSKDSLVQFMFSDINHVDGDITMIKDFPALTVFEASNYGFICSDFAAIGKIAGNLTRFRVTNSTFSGSIESFVAVARQNGATEHTINAFYFEGITFNGSPMTGGWNTPLSWTADTITYNGVTINA